MSADILPLSIDPVPPTAALWQQVARLIDCLGDAGFDAALADLCAGLAALRQCVVFAVPAEGDGAAACLFAWNRQESALAAALGQGYVDGRFDRCDPALAWHRRRLAGRQEGQSLALSRRSAIPDPAYRQRFFDGPRLDLKLSIFARAGGEAIYLNFYRHQADGAFQSDEITALALAAPVLWRALRRHHGGVTPASRAPSAPRQRVQTLRRALAVRGLPLTEREQDVCARIVAGYSSEAIALDLGIAASSVATYRKRAYAKLGICSQHDLFALCWGGEAEVF